MTDLRTAAQQALEALENGKRVRACEGGTKYQPPLEDSAITALRAALAQPLPDPVDEYRKGFIDGQIDMRDRPEEQEPVAWSPSLMYPNYEKERVWLNGKPRQEDVEYWSKNGNRITYVYTHPPRREWQGLKEWEINDGRDQLPTEDLCNWSFRQGVYFAEKALKERNA
jgi:hypothetical protein